MLTDRIVVGYFGNRSALESSVQAARDTGMEVIAVVLDLGAGGALAGWRDEALLAGAVRCHALDVREEFAKDVVLPGVKSGAGTDVASVITTLARAFVDRTLHSIATLEAAAVVDPDSIELPWLTRPRWHTSRGPAAVELRFADGAPVAINDIPMSLTEVLESVETISGEAAIAVLQRAYAEIHPAVSGRVVLSVNDGQVHAASTLAVS